MQKSHWIFFSFILSLCLFTNTSTAQETEPEAIGFDTILTVDPETYEEGRQLVSKSASDCYAFSFGGESKYVYQEFPYEITLEQLQDKEQVKLQFVDIGNCLAIAKEKYSLVVINQGKDPVAIANGPAAFGELVNMVSQGSKIIIHDINLNGHDMDDIIFYIK